MSAKEPAVHEMPMVKRECMRDRIRDVLVARILDGKYPAGTQLKELTLAREFNVSQAPIREALRELEGSGLVTSERYRGTRVRGADLQEMRESYELRATLELRAIELAVPCAPHVIDGMDGCLQEMQFAVARADVEHYIHHALLLHRRLIEAAQNRVFVTVWDSLHFDVRGRIALRRIAEKGGTLQPLLHLHGELLHQLRHANVAQAKKALSDIFAAVAAAFTP
jgi:DNA-binding GntR family transcriptional regulator